MVQSLCLRDRPATRSHFAIGRSQFSPHRRQQLYCMSDQDNDLEEYRYPRHRNHAGKSSRALYPDLHPMHSDDLCLQRGVIRPAPKRVQLSECGPMLRKQRHCSTLAICYPRPPKDPNRPANSPLLLTALIKKRIQALDYPIGEWIQWALVPDGDEGTSAAWSPKNTERRTATSRRRIAPGPEDSCNPNGGGVVDYQLGVYGVVGLRAAVSSIFPRVLASASCSVTEKYTVLP